MSAAVFPGRWIMDEKIIAKDEQLYRACLAAERQLIADWGVSKKYRFESFCYGPKSCKLYKMGKPRAVPYKDSGSSYDEGWMDDLCTENRGWDD